MQKNANYSGIAGTFVTTLMMMYLAPMMIGQLMDIAGMMGGNNIVGMAIYMDTTYSILNLLSVLFVLAVGVTVVIVVALFVIDLSQNKDAVRRNYPVVGRIRSLFSTLGELFRQDFFAMDREEMPFNRAERDWIYKSAQAETIPLPLDRPSYYPRRHGCRTDAVNGQCRIANQGFPADRH